MQRASEMVPWVKILSTKRDDQNLIPKTHMMEGGERKDSKFSSDKHMHVVRHAP